MEKKDIIITSVSKINPSHKIERGKIFIMTDVLPADCKGKISPAMVLALRERGQNKK